MKLKLLAAFVLTTTFSLGALAQKSMSEQWDDELRARGISYRVFRGTFQGQDCVTTVRFAKTENGVEVGAKVKGIEITHGLFGEGNLRDDYAYMSDVPGHSSTMLRTGVLVAPGRSNGSEHGPVQGMGFYRDEVHFSPNIETPNSLRFVTSHRFVLNDKRSFTCENLQELTGEDAQAYLRPRF